MKKDKAAIFAMASLASKASQFLGEKYIENTVWEDSKNPTKLVGFSLFQLINFSLGRFSSQS